MLPFPADALFSWTVQAFTTDGFVVFIPRSSGGRRPFRLGSRGARTHRDDEPRFADVVLPPLYDWTAPTPDVR